MRHYRIDQTLAALPGLAFNNDELGARLLLEELYDGAQDDLLAELVGSDHAAVHWNVSERRARAHIARLHERYGVGKQFGGVWVLRRRDMERHAPAQSHRRKPPLP